MFINDIVKDVSSDISLFADDYALYRWIETLDDEEALQNDFNKLCAWSHGWNMEFNVSKCYSMTITLKRRTIQNEYQISEVPIEKIESYKYLGIYISKDLRWNKTVDQIVGKANRSLGLILRNFSRSPRQVHEKLYFTLVPPHLAYACEVCSPHTKNRFVMGEYRQRSRMTDLLQQLKWDSLESRRLLFQLKYVHKMFTNQVALDPNVFFSPATFSITRNSNSLKIIPKFGRVDTVRFSFFYSIISVWNSLQDSIVMQANSDTFYNLCRNHLS